IPMEEQWLIWSVNVLLALVIFWMAFTADRAFKKSMSELVKSWSLRRKLDFYYEASFKKYLWVGLATLLAVFGYALYDGFLFIGLYVALLFFMSLGRPTERNIERAVQLSNEEKTLFRDKEQII
ncbi:MAG: hypothetical protein AAFO69_11410, partial [Bacteroidota bacterium]